jgi:hypothetical protein
MRKIIIFISACLIFYGCKFYSFYGTDDSGASTFSVELFEVKAPRANPLISQTFTESLRELIQQQSSVQLVEKNGELAFSGAIIQYNTQPITVTEDELASQSRLTIGIEVSYKNSLEKEKNFERKFSWYTDYSSDEDFLIIEEDLIAIITEQLTQDVYNASLGNW